MSCIAPHVIFNPQNERIGVPAFAIHDAKQFGCLETRSGLYKINSGYYEVLPLLEKSDQGPPKLKAVNYSKTRGSGRAKKHRLLMVLGYDCRGVHTWVQCDCSECLGSKEDADRTAMPFG